MLFRSLDASLANNSILNPAFVKIDIQGMELEVFKGAQSFLKNNCLGIRVEVYFHAIYENQPLFHEIDAYLRKLGFFPFQFARSISSTLMFPLELCILCQKTLSTIQEQPLNW